MPRPTDAEMTEWQRGILTGLARPREMFDALASERDRADKAEAWMRQVADGLGYSECGSETGGVWVCATADEVVAGLSLLVGTLVEEGVVLDEDVLFDARKVLEQEIGTREVADNCINGLLNAGLLIRRRSRSS